MHERGLDAVVLDSAADDWMSIGTRKGYMKSIMSRC